MAAYNLDTPFAYITSLLDLAAWMAVENPQRVNHDGDEGFFTRKDESEQLTALLTVTRDYARRALVEHDEAVKAFQPGGDA